MLTTAPAFLPPPAPGSDDRNLVARFQNGDESAFTQIMSAHRDRIYGYVRKILRDDTDAEEVTQDTFVRAYRALNRFRGDSSLATWLHRIATNLARNRYWYFFRRHRQDTISLDWTPPGQPTSPISDSLVCDRSSPRQNTSQAEFLDAVRDALDQLDPLYREAFELRAAKGLSYQEISALIGIPNGTVKSRIARARAELRALLASRMPEVNDTESFRDVFTSDRR